MRKFIMGYSQEKLLNKNLDIKDIMIIDFIVNFIKSGKLVYRNIDGKDYFWIKTKLIIECLPILNISSKEMIRARLKKLIKLNILECKLVKEEGNYTFYTIGEGYYDLKRLDNISEENNGVCKEKVIEDNLDKSNIELTLEADKDCDEEDEERVYEKDSKKEYEENYKENIDEINKCYIRKKKINIDVNNKKLDFNKREFFCLKETDYNINRVYKFKTSDVVLKVETKNKQFNNNKEKYNKKIYTKKFWIYKYFLNGY